MPQIAGMSKPKNYFNTLNIVTTEGSDSADILIYGVIGQERPWRDNRDFDITDVEFAKAIRDLEKRFNRINIRINSPGGYMFHGNAMMNAMRNSTAEIHTYNDGMAASHAAVLFLSAEHRHMAKNSLLMLHAPLNGVYGNAEQLRETANVLDKFQDTILLQLADTTGQSKDDLNEKYFADFKDHWMTYEDCVAEGFVGSEDSYEVENAPTDITNLSYPELIASFNVPENNSPEGRNLLQKIADAIIPKKTIPTQQNTTEMNIKELKEALKDGTLSIEDVQNAIEQNKPAPKTDIKTEITEAVNAAVAPLNLSLIHI